MIKTNYQSAYMAQGMMMGPQNPAMQAQRFPPNYYSQPMQPIQPHQNYSGNQNNNFSANKNEETRDSFNKWTLIISK